MSVLLELIVLLSVAVGLFAIERLVTQSNEFDK
jgi:hypothetical protein